MRNLILGAAIALAAIGGGAAVASHQSRAERDAAEAARFDKALAGLTPTETNDCLPSTREQSSLKSYGTRLVYRVSNRLAYVTDTGGGCEAVASGDILVTKSNFGRLCRGDIATTIQPGSNVLSGSCALGSFTAWRK